MLTIKKLKTLSSDEIKRIVDRSGTLSEEIQETVEDVIASVRERGDRAIKEYTEEFDGVHLDSLMISRIEVQEAYNHVPADFVPALEQARAHITKFHEATKIVEKKLSTDKGIETWREWRAIDKVGLYIPGGKARYPSSVLMTVIPAQISGCTDIVICTPPDKNGKAPAATLVACDLLGVSKIYKIGGAQAIAAMAYGTESVYRVYKIFGAGNAYVTAAKMQVFGAVDIDSPAGPSDIMVLADTTANPRFVAADLISQAEHGVDSPAVLITDTVQFAYDVQAAVKEQVEALPGRQDMVKASLENHGLILLVDGLEEGIDFINEYAPEHLEIVTNDDERYLSMINNVGSVFLGSYSPVPAGDFASGTNHVLPTNGYAKMFSPLSVESFGKKIQVQRLSKAGLAKIRSTIGVLADVEGFPAHKNACEIRFTEEGDQQELGM